MRESAPDLTPYLVKGLFGGGGPLTRSCAAIRAFGGQFGSVVPFSPACLKTGRLKTSPKFVLSQPDRLLGHVHTLSTRHSHHKTTGVVEEDSSTASPYGTSGVSFFFFNTMLGSMKIALVSSLLFLTFLLFSQRIDLTSGAVANQALPPYDSSLGTVYLS